jgi:hypothetical protein
MNFWGEDMEKMTNRKMSKLIREIPYDDFGLNDGIYEFYGNDVLSLGISFETNEDTLQNVYVFNLFYKGEYININGCVLAPINFNDAELKQMITELVTTWNNFSKGTD